MTRAKTTSSIGIAALQIITHKFKIITASNITTAPIKVMQIKSTFSVKTPCLPVSRRWPAAMVCSLSKSLYLKMVLYTKVSWFTTAH